MEEVRRVWFFLLCFLHEDGKCREWKKVPQFGAFFFLSRVKVVSKWREWREFLGFGSLFFVSRVKMVKGENGRDSPGLVFSSLFLV